ncbi:hypothetical protein GGR58DRAFT_274251 [Xylaria digitata]|nr:hypothetical protein GGR58DRAFT_274251 [Xylaria digitata]
MTEDRGVLIYAHNDARRSSRSNADDNRLDAHTHIHTHAHTHTLIKVTSTRLKWRSHQHQLVLLEALSTRCICTRVETAVQNIPPVVVGIVIRRTGPRSEMRRRPRRTTT